MISVHLFNIFLIQFYYELYHLLYVQIHIATHESTAQHLFLTISSFLNVWAIFINLNFLSVVHTTGKHVNQWKGTLVIYSYQNWNTWPIFETGKVLDPLYSPIFSKRLNLYVLSIMICVIQVFQKDEIVFSKNDFPESKAAERYVLIFSKNMAMWNWLKYIANSALDKYF